IGTNFNHARLDPYPTVQAPSNSSPKFYVEPIMLILTGGGLILTMWGWGDGGVGGFFLGLLGAIVYLGCLVFMCIGIKSNLESFPKIQAYIFMGTSVLVLFYGVHLYDPNWSSNLSDFGKAIRHIIGIVFCLAGGIGAVASAMLWFKSES
ncbi:MAG: hypothetical protein AAF399_27695, partial [Bacteroidota bacterium]